MKAHREIVKSIKIFNEKKENDEKNAVAKKEIKFLPLTSEARTRTNRNLLELFITAGKAKLSSHRSRMRNFYLIMIERTIKCDCFWTLLSYFPLVRNFYDSFCLLSLHFHFHFLFHIILCFFSISNVRYHQDFKNELMWKLPSFANFLLHTVVLLCYAFTLAVSLGMGFSVVVLLIFRAKNLIIYFETRNNWALRMRVKNGRRRTYNAYGKKVWFSDEIMCVFAMRDMRFTSLAGMDVYARRRHDSKILQAMLSLRCADFFSITKSVKSSSMSL